MNQKSEIRNHGVGVRIEGHYSLFIIHDSRKGFSLFELLIYIAVLAVAFMRLFFMESEGWLKIGRALLVPFV